MSFDTLGLSDGVLSAVTDAGYSEPTPIQRDAIPVVLSGRDLLGIAQTGTGKTASFTLPMIEILSRGKARARMPRSLILAPTRELAAQVSENFETYGKNTKLTMALLIGGVSFGEQDKKLDRGVDVLIATPGRLIDHIERGKVMLTGVQILVVDEADRMLDMGFIPDIERICKLVPFTRQTLFFSATMPPEIQKLTTDFQQAPARIEVARQATTAENIDQFLCYVPGRDFQKRDALRKIIESQKGIKNGIIFCNRKRDVDVVAKSMYKHKYKAAPLHGDLDQRVRMATLEKFKSGEIDYLIASDVAARGLDIPAVSHVFNFDVPTHSEDYVHRIGRTGRAGLEGTAITLATNAEKKYVDQIEALVKKTLPILEVEGLDANATGGDEGRSSGRSGGRSGGRGDGKGRGGNKGARPPRKRGGQSGGGGGSENKPTEKRQAKPADAAKSEKPVSEKPKAQNKNKDDGGERKARPSRRLGKSRDENKGGGKQQQGMGDHMPAFLTNSSKKKD